MRKKAKILIMVMVVLVAMSMAASQALAVAPVVGVVCLQHVGDTGGSGALGECAVAAARMCEYAGCDVYMIDSGDIVDNNILSTIDLIVFPGGYAVAYKKFFAPSTGDAVRNAIRSFISGGGAYMGLCAGAHAAVDICAWEGRDFEYYLDLFMGDGVGSINDISSYPDGPLALTTIRMVDPDFSWENETFTIGYLWGPYFSGYDGAPLPEGIDVVGRYDYEVGGQPGEADEEAAMIKFEFGNGRVFLSGPHPEYEESTTLSNSRDWAFGDDYDTTSGDPQQDPDTEYDIMADIIGWLCPGKTISKGLPSPYTTTAAVFGTCGASTRALWATMKMLRSLGVEPYAYTGCAADEITIDKFDLAVYPNGKETVMDNYIDVATCNTFLANGGHFMGFGGGAKLVGVHLDYWGGGQDLSPPAQHGMEDVTIVDADTGSGTYSVAYWKEPASADGHHWDGLSPTNPTNYTPISWTSAHVDDTPGAVEVGYFTDEGSSQICMVKYPWGNGGSKIFMSAVDPGTHEGSNSTDGCQWDDGTKGYFDPDSEWGLIDNILTWMGL